MHVCDTSQQIPAPDPKKNIRFIKALGGNSTYKHP